MMQCAGALSLAEKAPRFESVESESRRESEAAHYLLNVLLNDPQVALNEIKCPNGFIITDEMEEHVINVSMMIRYRDFGATLYPTPTMDFSFPDAIVIRSKPDCVAWNGDTHTLYIDELKYGWRVVEVEQNWQMIAAAVGAVIRCGYTPKQVIFTLHQPRPYHPGGTMRQFVMSRDELGKARLMLLDQVKRDDTTCSTGPNCYGCPAAGICPSASMAACAAFDVSFNGASDEISNDALGFELLLLQRAEESLKIRKKALEEIAKNRLHDGQHVQHWALKSSQSNRNWLDGITADLVKSMTGVDVSKVDIVSPAQAEKMGVSKDIVNSFTHRKSNGFNLVRQDLNKVFGSK